MPSVYLYLSRGLLPSTLELFEPVVASQLWQQKAFCQHNDDEKAGQEVETSASRDVSKSRRHHTGRMSSDHKQG